AQQNKSDNPTIAGKKDSQRYFEDLSEEDQVCVNADYNTFNAKIMNKCEGADHMGTGHRTEFDTGPHITCEEAIAQYREEHKRQSSGNNCLTQVAGLRYKIM